MERIYLDRGFPGKMDWLAPGIGNTLWSLLPQDQWVKSKSRPRVSKKHCVSDRCWVTQVKGARGPAAFQVNRCCLPWSWQRMKDHA